MEASAIDTTTLSDAAVAKVIVDQLGGCGRLGAMLGAKMFVLHRSGVSFKFPNPSRNRPNYCLVELADDDTYTVTMGRVVKFDLRSKSTVAGIHVDQLRELFENATGLRLSL